MKKCPNCDREAVRTEDWSCQWCGYPLMSGSYKKIGKTFKELREERLPPQPVMQQLEAETMPAAEPIAEPEPEPALEAEPEPIAEPEPEPALEAEPEPIPEPEPEPALDVGPEPAPESKPKPRRKPVTGRKSTAKSKTTTEAKSPKSTTKPKTAARTKSAPKVETGPAPADIEITVDGLLSAYATEGEAAGARFTNKIIRMTGVISRIEVNDTLDIYFITLNGAEEGRLMQGVRCIFDRQYVPELNQLTSGQTVTVQGKCDGSIIDLSLRDCLLVG